MRHLPITAMLLAACTALLPRTSCAQSDDAWRFQGVIYGYLPQISGNTTFPQVGTGGGVTVDAQTIIEHLKFTFMGSLEVSRGRWGLFTDVIYLNLGDTKSDLRQFTIGGTSLPADVSASVSYDMKGWVATIGGTWRVSSDPVAPFDLVAGARLLDMSQTLGWQTSGNVASIPTQGRAGESRVSLSNWDAIVGVKGRLGLDDSRHWSVPYYFDVGTGQSTRTLQAMAGIAYTFGWGDLVGAWRYLDYGMKSGKAVESLNFNGPAIAAVFRW